MRFPLSYDSLRLRTAATFAYHDDSKMAPDNYDPAREMVALLVNTEESLIQRDDKLYLNWGKLRLATIFEQVLNLIELGGAYLEQDMQPTLEVSGFFANHQFLEEYQETAKYHFLRAFKDLAGYDTELCKEFAVGLTIPDLKHSYEVYSRDIAPLPDFDTEMRALLGEKYEEVLELATREPFDREQRFPLFLEDLRRRALKDFKAGVEDSEGAPADYSPGDDIVKVLQEQEHSLLLKENKVYLDWGKLKLEEVLDAALDGVKHGGPVDEDIPAIHCFSGYLRHEFNPDESYREWASTCFITALDKTLGYDTSCADWLIGLTLSDLELSYHAYQRDIGELPEFQVRLRELLGDHYEAGMKHLYGLKGEVELEDQSVESRSDEDSDA